MYFYFALPDIFFHIAGAHLIISLKGPSSGINFGFHVRYN